MGQLILASRSPQRRAILEQLGIVFEVVVPNVEELEAGSAEAVATENARRKASAVAAKMPRARVLGVDTVVECDGRLYGKPQDRAAAEAALRALSSRTHHVVSGVCLTRGTSREPCSATAITAVRFRALDEATIAWYLDSQEWRDRAGGYAIQGLGAALVAELAGDYLNVVGLPLATLLELAPDLHPGSAD